jgi:hypothetical protein
MLALAREGDRERKRVEREIAAAKVTSEQDAREPQFASGVSAIHWLERLTLDEVRELAGGIWGP